MKIAVLFLCLSIASFIDTCMGQNVKLQTLDKTKIDSHVRGIQAIGEKFEILKTCPEGEKKTRQLSLIEDLLFELKMISLDVGCTLKDLLKIMELPLNIIELILANNLEALLEQLKLETLLNSVLCLVEGILAQIGCVLKTQLLTLTNLLGPVTGALGSVTGVLSIVSGLHNTVSDVAFFLTGTVLGSTLGIVNGLFQALSGILGGGLLGNGLLG